MAWINVTVYIDGEPGVPNVINTDTIVRFGPNRSGSYIHFVDGTSTNVTDDFKEIGQVIASAKES
jgi:hypothetical protein